MQSVIIQMRYQFVLNFLICNLGTMRNLNWILIFISFFTFQLTAQNSQDNCLFKNPMCFYTTDILTYLQALHRNMQYEEMLPFLFGPEVEGKSNELVMNLLDKAPFGYQMKRVGIRIIEPQKVWTLRFERILLGTKETFDIECRLVDGVCKLYLDSESWNRIFRSYGP